VSWLAENRAVLKSVNYAYSHIPKICPRATHQARSGRCWLFAALNTMRYHLIEQLNLNDSFELSEAYLFFYDKIERSLHFMEKIIELRDLPVHHPVIHGMLTYFSPVTDGGMWSFFVNLILKYGIVPKSCYGENFNSMNTDDMNSVLHAKLGQFAAELRSSALSSEELQKLVRTQYMPEIYTLMVKFLGEPPSEFQWCYHESGESFESVRSRGTYRCVPNLTPRIFYETYLEPEFRLGNKVVLRHDPRDSSEYYRTYHVEHVGQMVGGRPEVALNVPWDVLSRTAATEVMNGHHLWFGADVCKDLNDEHGILSTEAYDYNSLLNTSVDMDKATSLDTYLSCPSHAMALVGVDVVDNSPDHVVKWKVENSWGEFNGGADPGYLLMTQAWFQRYGYEVVVDRDALDQQASEAYDKYEYDPIVLPYNDAFGAVARNCKQCSMRASLREQE